MNHSNLDIAKKIMDIHIKNHEKISDLTDTYITWYLISTFGALRSIDMRLNFNDLSDIFNYSKRYVKFLQTRPPGTIGVGFMNPESPQL